MRKKYTLTPERRQALSDHLAKWREKVALDPEKLKEYRRNKAKGQQQRLEKNRKEAEERKLREFEQDARVVKLNEIIASKDLEIAGLEATISGLIARLAKLKA